MSQFSAPILVAGNRPERLVTLAAMPASPIPSAAMRTRMAIRFWALAGLACSGVLAGCTADTVSVQPAAVPPAPVATYAPAPAPAPKLPDTLVAKRTTPTGATVALADLPAPGAVVYRTIFQGGPFAFEKDGAVFANRERLLPRQPRGYYREYTVAKPRAKNRGARRIVCGGAPTQPEVCYYTADHYASFQTIVP